jgi:hypothetical protein
MTSQNAELITQLNTLLRLTSHEAATARVRVSQATSDATRKELLENAQNCDLRADSLRQAVRDLGGAPDVLGVALGKAAAAAKLPFEQIMPLTEALLTDLALEHQLFTVLSETALNGPAALAPTPMQAAATTARNAATFARSVAATGVNKVVETATSITEKVQESTTNAVVSNVGRLMTLAGSAKQIARVGRDATLAEIEKQAAKELGKDKASAVHNVREHLGAVNADELPIKGFDALTVKDAANRIAQLPTADDVQVVLAYEKANKNREAVAEAATKRVRDLAKDLVNS